MVQRLTISLSHRRILNRRVYSQPVCVAPSRTVGSPSQCRVWYDRLWCPRCRNKCNSGCTGDPRWPTSSVHRETLYICRMWRYNRQILISARSSRSLIKPSGPLPVVTSFSALIAIPTGCMKRRPNPTLDGCPYFRSNPDGIGHIHLDIRKEAKLEIFRRVTNSWCREPHFVDELNGLGVLSLQVGMLSFTMIMIC
jgi:hypothetical protein